jgi:hypothetical protein
LALIVSIFLVSLIVDYAARYIVLKDLEVIASIKKAWALIKKNESQSFLAFLVALASNFAYSIVFAMATFFVSTPLVLFAIIGDIGKLIMVVLLVCLLPIPAGYWAAFNSAYWTNIFIALVDIDKETVKDLKNETIIAGEKPQSTSIEPGVV